MRKVLAGIFLFSAGFFLASRWALKNWRDETACGKADMPITFFRPIKSGEADICSKLHVFLAGTRSGDQVIIGTSEEFAPVDELQKNFPDLRIDHVVCKPGLHANPKINKLAQMERFAIHPRWLALDSDTLCDASVLEELRGEWPEEHALTAPYYFVQARTGFARLDGTATCLGLWPGVALLRAAGKNEAMFGACLGVPADSLRSLGGWAAWGDAFAEDNALGRAMVSRGVKIHLARTAVPIDAGGIGIVECLRHQHRLLATYHQCDPVGTLGLPLTHGIAFALFAFLLRGDRRALGAHLALWALRHCSTRDLPGGPRVRAIDTWLVSIFEPFFWLAGILPIAPHWAGWLGRGRN